MTTTAASSDTTTTQTGSDSQTTQPSDTGTMIPKGRLDEVIQQRKALAERVEAFEKAESQRKQAALEAKGEFDTVKQQLEADLLKLREENTTLSAAQKKLEAIQTAQREAQIAALPENRREFAGKLDDERLAEYVTTHATNGVHFATEKPGGPAGELTMAEIRKMPMKDQQVAYQAYLKRAGHGATG